MALAVAAVLAGAILQSAAGFGFALVAAPLLVAAVGPVPAVGALTVTGVTINAMTLAAEARRPRPLRGETAALLAWSLPGLAAGALALRHLPEAALEALVGVTVLAALALRAWGRVVDPGVPAAALTSGALATSTGISGPPVVLRLLALRPTPATVRDTLATIFLVQGLAGLALLALAGALEVPAAIGWLLAATVAGQVLGRGVFARLHPERHERLVLAVLLVTAVAALVAAAPAP